jgi:hypothetical protein
MLKSFMSAYILTLYFSKVELIPLIYLLDYCLSTLYILCAVQHSTQQSELSLIGSSLSLLIRNSFDPESLCAAQADLDLEM